MRIIAGGHGQIALRLERFWELESASVADIAQHLATVGANVFAAGAGPGSGIDREDSVDRAAASLLADAAEAAGVRRFLVVSAWGPTASPRSAPTLSTLPICTRRARWTRTYAPGLDSMGPSCASAASSTSSALVW